MRVCPSPARGHPSTLSSPEVRPRVIPSWRGGRQRSPGHAACGGLHAPNRLRALLQPQCLGLTSAGNGTLHVAQCHKRRSAQLTPCGERGAQWLLMETQNPGPRTAWPPGARFPSHTVPVPPGEVLSSQFPARSPCLLPETEGVGMLPWIPLFSSRHARSQACPRSSEQGLGPGCGEHLLHAEPAQSAHLRVVAGAWEGLRERPAQCRCWCVPLVSGRAGLPGMARACRRQRSQALARLPAPSSRTRQADHVLSRPSRVGS